MRNVLLPVAALLLSTALLLAAHGLLLTLLPLYAEQSGFSANEIGLTGSAYYVGFVLGCLLTPVMVRRVGHIRSFAVLGSSYSALALLFFAFPNFWGWIALRLAIGAAIAGMHMVIESWLNERATKETRGTLLSVYTMICLLMITVGQQLLNLAEPGSGTLFGLAAILFSLAIIPVALTTSLAPAPINRVKISPRKLWRVSRVGTLGGIAGGLIVGAFWTLGPVYARGIGLDTFQLSVFISAVVMGGALFQLPLGRLSDHFDRRLVLLGSALLGIGSSLALGLNLLPDFNATAVLALVWGGSVMTMYAICLAHANDRAAPEDFVLVSSAMLLIHGVAAAVGGPLASLMLAAFGPGGLFLFAAINLGWLVPAILIRLRTHAMPMVDVTEPFLPVSDQGSTQRYEMDPRTEDDYFTPPEPEPEPESDPASAPASASDPAASARTTIEEAVDSPHWTDPNRKEP